MKTESTLEKLRDNIIEFRTDEITKDVEEAINTGLDPQDIVNALSEGLDIIGERYQKGEAFLPELISAGETMREAMEVIGPHLKKNEENLGVVSIGTVKGDLHDIGKNIVKAFLTANGFKVQDLGVDVGPEKFVNSLRTSHVDIVAISALLTNAVPEVGTVIKSLGDTGLRKTVKIIVGGAALNNEAARDVRADAYESDAVSGASRCVSWRSPS